MRAPSRRALLAAGALAACAPARQRPGAVRFWAMGDEAVAAPGLLGEFRASNPGLRPEVQALPWGAAHERLLTAYVGRALPDMAQIGNTWLAEMAAIGALSPVPDAHADLLADNFAGVLETNRIGGRYYGLPWYVDTRLLFYRKDLLADAGVAAPPRDWEAWKQAMRALKRRQGAERFAALMPLDEYEHLLTLGLQQPEPLLRDGFTRGNFSTPGFVDALAFYKSLFDERLAPLLSSPQVASVGQEFARGYFAFYISGPWSLGDFRRDLPAPLQDQWGVAEMPGPDGPGASASGGSSLVVFRSAANPEGAWRLVRYLLQPRTQVAFTRLTGDLPAHTAAWADPALMADPHIAAFARQLSRAKPLPQVPEWERIATEMQVVAELMVRGNFPPREAAAEMDRRADALLEKRRWMLARGRAA